MPTDDLFDDDKPGTGTDDQPDDAPKDGTPVVDTAKVAALEAQLTTVQQALQEGAGERATLQAAVQALQAQLAAAQAGDDEEPVQTPDAIKAARDAKFTKFYEDPEGFIAKQAAEVAKGTFGPYLRAQAEQRAAEILDAQRERIDGLHGAGTFDKYFAKDVGAALRELPLEMQASRPHVQRAVESIYGRLHMDDTTRAELLKARETLTKSKAAPPSLMDGGRPAPKAGTLSDEQQAFLASLARSGIQLDPKEYLAASTRGNTEDAWRPAPKARR